VKLQYVLDGLGADSWAQVFQEFAGEKEADVLAALNEMFPDDENSDLAAGIVYAIRQYGADGPTPDAEF